MKSRLLFLGVVCLLGITGRGMSKTIIGDTEFTCSPKEVNRGDTIVLTFQVPHGQDLAVLTPDKKFVHIVYGPSGGIAEPDEFRSMKTLEINTETHTGWLDEDNPDAPVFRKPGKYTFLLSDNLESEDYGHTECAIVLKQAKKGHR